MATASREVAALPGQWRLESDDEWGMWFDGLVGDLWYIMVFLDGRWMVVDLNAGKQAVGGPWQCTAQKAWDALGRGAVNAPKAP